MSYAIVRNEKLTRAEINGKGTHNDRKAKNHIIVCTKLLIISIKQWINL